MKSVSLISKIKGGAKVGFFGIGKSNLSLMKLLPLGNCEITLRSDKAIVLPDGYISKGNINRVFSGDKALLDLDEDVLFTAPSVRRGRKELLEATERGCILSSDAELFLENNTKLLFAVSGSDGKSTTSTLTELLLSETLNAGIVGNIGIPMYETLISENKNAYVAELSSFMLAYTNPKAKRAALTNITENHLDFHGSFAEYTDAKLSLLRNCEEAVINCDDAIIRKYREGKSFAAVSAETPYSVLKSEISSEIYITLEQGFIYKNGEKILSAEQIKANSPHNLKNLMTAMALSEGYYTPAHLRQVAKEFCGLPHRAHLFASKGGIDFIDSSIDTSPARTIATLKSLKKKVIIILGGGKKGLSYDSLKEYVSEYVKHAVIVGDNSEEIYSAIKNCTKTLTVDNFEDAIISAIELCQEGDTLLLSPASTSYDRFNNFEERGNLFKKTVLDYYEKTKYLSLHQKPSY